MLVRRCSRLLNQVCQQYATTAARAFNAAVCTEQGKIEVREMKELSPREDEMVIEVESAGVNSADMKMINGDYYLKPKHPFIPGFELAGNVKSVGAKVAKWKEGDRVVVLRASGTGAFAQECLINPLVDSVVALPYSIDYESAAAISIAYGTAYLALQKMAKDREGARVLVLSSRGMIAFAAIDLAHNLFKAHVIAASNTEDNLSKLRETGVDTTVNYEKEKLKDVVRKNTLGQGVDVVIDTVGGKVFTQALSCIRPSGQLMSLGFTSGEIPTISLLDLHRTQAVVSGIWLGGHQQDEVEKIVQMLLQLFEEQFLQARIERKYLLNDIAKCVEDINSDKIFGKAIINMKE